MFAKMLVTFPLLCLGFCLGCASETKLHADGHMPLGKTKVWPFLDGELPMTPALVQGISSEEKLKILGLEAEEEVFMTPVNVYLIEWGERRILIDAGCDAFMGPSAGKLASALKAKGFEPASIDTVLITHMHGDHFGGLIALQEMRLRFPQATVWFHETELAFWANPQLLELCPEAQKTDCRQIQEGLQLLSVSLGEKLKTFSSGQNLLAGIYAIHTPGHTPGHTAFMLESDGEKLLFIGDLIFNLPLQTAFPRAYAVFDFDASTAIHTRLQWMEKAAKEGFWIAGAHLPHPGIGRLEKQSNEKFSFIPIGHK